MGNTNMAKEITITAYEFSELCLTVQEKIIEQEKESIQFDPCIYTEQFMETLEKLGITQGNILYSMSNSQGDGACFDKIIGDISPESIDSFIDEVFYYQAKIDFSIKTDLLILKDFLTTDKNTLCIQINQSGRYFHENSMNYSIDFDDPYKEPKLEGQRELAYNEIIETIFKSLAKHAFSELTDLYESEFSDETIEENLKLQEGLYTIDGYRID